LLIALALLTLLNIALALLTLTINVLRTLCGLLFRFLITIRAARLLIHLVFIFHNYLAPSNLRKWCLKDWMEELARILSENEAAAFEFRELRDLRSYLVPIASWSINKRKGWAKPRSVSHQ